MTVRYLMSFISSYVLRLTKVIIRMWCFSEHTLSNIKAHGFARAKHKLAGVTCRKSIEATGALHSLTGQLTAQGHSGCMFVPCVMNLVVYSVYQ